MERREKHFLYPEASGPKFFNDESAEAFVRINFGGSKMTFNGFTKSLKETTKLVTNAMELKGNHTKNLQALQRTYKFFSLVWQYIEFKDVYTLNYFYIEEKIIGKLHF